MSVRLRVPRAVVHIPHASTVVPPDIPFILSKEALAHELLVMTDHFTDELFRFEDTVATRVVFPVSRVVVDAERFADDEHEPMAAKGMGVVYSTTHDGMPLRLPLGTTQRDDLLARFYDPHHLALTLAVEAAIAAHGSCLIIDGHSFPAHPLPYETTKEHRPGICIGTDFFHTPAWLRDTSVAAFEDAGWQVMIDTPFSGSLVPQRFYRSDPRVLSVMIEVNRSLYMDEATGERLPIFASVASRVQAALARVMAAQPSS